MATDGINQLIKRTRVSVLLLLLRSQRSRNGGCHHVRIWQSFSVISSYLQPRVTCDDVQFLAVSVVHSRSCH